jgi:hypothetical protein
MPNDSGCDSLKNSTSSASFAAMYADQACLTEKVCPIKMLSINRVHEVSSHYLIINLCGKEAA